MGRRESDWRRGRGILLVPGKGKELVFAVERERERQKGELREREKMRELP